VSQVAS